MDASINAPGSLGNVKQLDVWFEGNGSTTQTVYEGQGVCFNWDYGTAATETFNRLNRVELPAILNARYFAGVLAKNYTIPANGRVVTIYGPGSHCRVLSKANTTIGVGILTCTAGGTYAGYWQYAGFEGEGSCVPLQTVDRSSTAGLCQAVLQTGNPSGLLEVLTLTAGGASTMMVGGTTVFAAATLAADATFTVADGTIEGLKKRFYTAGTQTTNNVVVTVNGIQDDGTTALASWTTDTATENLVLEWHGDWFELGHSGGVIA
jgi:hypothetical protein